MTKKILLIGRGGVGKTSIKQVIFDGKDPKNLILFPLDPTRGISSSVYKWMDLELSLFDTSGQELPIILEDENERNKAFENAEVIIYTIDYFSWVSQSKEIIDEIEIVYNIVKSYNKIAKFIIFFHKVDLINQKFKENFQSLESEIKNNFSQSEELKIYFTSLHPNLLHSTYNAFFEILSNLSEKTSTIKNAIDSVLKDYNRTACFITNKNDFIIIQDITPDFEVALINKIHMKIAQMYHTSEGVLKVYEKMFLIDIGTKILSRIIVNLEGVNSDLKKLLIFSEIYDLNQLVELINKLKKEIKYIYKKE